MTNYLQYYDLYRFPTISSDYIASFSSENGIMTKVLDFSKPFRLVMNFFDIFTSNGHILKGTSLLNDDHINTFDIFQPSYNTAIFAVGDGANFNDINVSYDRGNANKFILEWDGSVYTAYIEYKDGTTSNKGTLTRSTAIPTCRLHLGVNMQVSSDLKMFELTHTDGSYKVKLVEEINEISEHDTIDAKLRYLEETKRLIKQTLLAQGCPVNENTPFRSFCNMILSGLKTSNIWRITDGGNTVLSTKAPIYLSSSSGNNYGVIASNYLNIQHASFSDSSKMSLYLYGGQTFEKYNTEKYRNSIIGFYRDGTGNYLGVAANKKSDYVHPSMGYFVTGDNAQIIKCIPEYDASYNYKPDKYPDNFLTANRIDNSITLKAGDYQADPTKPITEGTVTVGTDTVLEYSKISNYISWRDSDRNYSLMVLPPSTTISISTFNPSLPQIDDYIRSRKMKTTSSTTNITIYNGINSSYQYFTNDFVDFSTNIQNSQSLYFRKDTSLSFGFNEVGDQYIIRTEVGDGFRNYISDDSIYTGSYLGDPTYMTHTRQLTMLDGSTRLLDDGANKDITIEELRNIDYIDDIYTVNSTSNYNYGRSVSISNIVQGLFMGRFSQPIELSTSYNRLNLTIPYNSDISNVNLYINMDNGLVPDSFTSIPKYPVMLR